MKNYLAIVSVLILSVPALAHDHNEPNLDSWYQSLQRPDRPQYGYQGIVSCCNKEDCHPTEAEHRGDDWWAQLIEMHGGEGTPNAWVKVPPEKILKNTTNPTGRAVLCHTQAWVGSTFSPGSVVLYCFVPGFES